MGRVISYLLIPASIRHKSWSAGNFKAYPFDKPVEGVMQPEMARETVEIMKTATEKGVMVNLGFDRSWEGQNLFD